MTGTPSKRPAVRSLACAVAFALVSLPHGAMSEVLDGETLVLNPDSSIEEWTLLNGAQLIVDGAGTRSINASQNSRVQMQGAAAQVNDDEQDVETVRPSDELGVPEDRLSRRAWKRTCVSCETLVPVGNYCIECGATLTADG